MPTLYLSHQIDDRRIATQLLDAIIPWLMSLPSVRGCVHLSVDDDGASLNLTDGRGGGLKIPFGELLDERAGLPRGIAVGMSLSVLVESFEDFMIETLREQWPVNSRLVSRVGDNEVQVDCLPRHPDQVEPLTIVT